MIHIIELHKTLFAFDVAFKCDTANTQNLHIFTDIFHFLNVGDNVVDAEAVLMNDNMAVDSAVNGSHLI